jgi:hypothetical protein
MQKEESPYPRTEIVFITDSYDGMRAGYINHYGKNYYLTMATDKDWQYIEAQEYNEEDTYTEKYDNDDGTTQYIRYIPRTFNFIPLTNAEIDKVNEFIRKKTEKGKGEAIRHHQLSPFFELVSLLPSIDYHRCPEKVDRL